MSLTEAELEAANASSAAAAASTARASAAATQRLETEQRAHALTCQQLDAAAARASELQRALGEAQASAAAAEARAQAAGARAAALGAVDANTQLVVLRERLAATEAELRTARSAQKQAAQVPGLLRRAETAELQVCGAGQAGEDARGCRSQVA